MGKEQIVAIFKSVVACYGLSSALIHNIIYDSPR